MGSLWKCRGKEDDHGPHEILIHGYNLMDNHYHMILETPRENLLKGMPELNSDDPSDLNRKYG